LCAKNEENEKLKIIMNAIEILKDDEAIAQNEQCQTLKSNFFYFNILMNFLVLNTFIC
jgi:hypothetical protein